MSGKINIKLVLKVIIYIGGILVAIYLILIASGYKFDKGQKKFVQTGAIHLSSNIRDDLNVYLNGKLRSKKTPLKIKYLLPGNYNVSIVKDGYKKWEKTLEVKPGLVSTETDIILFFDEVSGREINQIEGAIGFTLSKSGNEITFWTEDKAYWQKVDNGEPEEIYTLSSETIADINLNGDLDKLLVETRDLEGHSLFYYCSSRPCKNAFDLNRGLKLNFEFAKLTLENKYPILATAEKNLYIVSSDYQNQYLDSKVIDFDYFDNQIVYSRQGEEKIEILKRGVNDTKPEVIFSEEIKGRMVSEAYSVFVDKEKNRLYIINKDGGLLEYDKGKKEFIPLGCNATGLIFDNSNFLLIQNNNELWVQGQVLPTDKKESIHLVARYSSNIFDPGWLEKSNYILFISEGILRAVHIKGNSETELYKYQGITNDKYSSIGYTQIITLDQGKLKNIKVTEKGSFINLW